MEYTLSSYKEWWGGLKDELAAIKESIPQKQTEKIIYACAAKLNVSGATVRNYLDGTGTNPFTALSVKETIQEIISDQQNN